MRRRALLSGLALSATFFLVSQTIQAQEVEQGHNKMGSANIEITPGTQTITPPPTEPFPSTGPMLPVKTLGITSATDLYFDAVSLTSTTITRDALYIRSDGTPISNIDGLSDILQDGSVYVPGYSVTDRRGNGAGWNLTLQLGDFIEQNVGPERDAHKLKGVTLYFPEVTPNTTKGVSGSIAPSTFSQTFDAGGSAKVLMSASENQGMGLWEARYHSRALKLSDNLTTEKKPIQLSIPSNNYAGKYQATLTWVVADAPISSVAE